MAHYTAFAGTFVLYILILALIGYVAFRPISETYLGEEEAKTKSDDFAFTCNEEGVCFKNTSPTHVEVTIKEPQKRVMMHTGIDMKAPVTINGSLVATAADVEKVRFPGPRGETGPQGIPGSSFDPSQTYESVRAKQVTANKGSGWGTAINVNAPVQPESLYALHFGNGEDIHGRQAGMGYIANQPNKIFSSRGTLASHIHQDDDFMMYSSGWNPLLGIKGGSGDAYVRGKATVGELCINSTCIKEADIKKLKMGSSNNGLPHFTYYKDNGNVSGTSFIHWNKGENNYPESYTESDGRYTAPITGVYVVSIMGMSPHSGQQSLNNFHMALFKNGRVVNNFQPLDRTVGEHPGASGTTVVKMAKGDYLQVWVASGLYGVGNSHNQFSGHMIA
jgi:hypothetical protein